jgi:hypothetical protein
VRIGTNRWIGKVTKFVDLTLRTVSIVVGAFARADPTKFPSMIEPYVAGLQKGWMLPFVLIATPLAFWASSKTNRGKMDKVHGLLDQLRDHTFRNQNFDNEQNGRVTLFKHHRYSFRRWPIRGGWLVPVERSGESTRNTNAIFRAPDDGEESEGVAGRAWSKRANVYVGALPNLRRSPTEDQFNEYAEKSFVSVERLRKKPPQACSLFGIPIEVDQKRWGVIVIDSTHPSIQQRCAKDCMRQLAPILSIFLRGA